MAVSSDSLQLAVVAETTPGVTPATPSFDLVRITGEGLTFEPTSTQSNEMGGSSRGVKDSILTGAQVTGDINFELAKSPAFEKLLAAALANNWGNDPHNLTVTADQVYDYSLLKTFTIEKRWKLDDTPTYSYHRFSGCMINTMTLSITPGEPITGSFGLVGNDLKLGTAAIVGATYNPAGANPVMTAPLVTSIVLKDPITGQPVTWLNNSCFTNVEISINNNGRGIQCIGFLGTKETVLGRFECSISGSLYYANDEPLQALIDQDEFEFEVVCTDSAGHSYTFDFKRVKFSTATVVATGTNEDVLVDFTLQGLEDDVHPITVQITRADPVTP
jgi:hypothetical protein